MLNPSSTPPRPYNFPFSMTGLVAPLFSSHPVPRRALIRTQQAKLFEKSVVKKDFNFRITINLSKFFSKNQIESTLSASLRVLHFRLGGKAVDSKSGCVAVSPSIMKAMYSQLARVFWRNIAMMTLVRKPFTVTLAT